MPKVQLDMNKYLDRKIFQVGQKLEGGEHDRRGGASGDDEQVRHGLCVGGVVREKKRRLSGKIETPEKRNYFCCIDV